jgi:hypothetical protein
MFPHQQHSTTFKFKLHSKNQFSQAYENFKEMNNPQGFIKYNTFSTLELSLQQQPTTELGKSLIQFKFLFPESSSQFPSSPSRQKIPVACSLTFLYSISHNSEL